MILKLDGFDGQDTESAVDVSLWITETATAGDWIATHPTDVTNPGGIEGDSFRIADVDEAPAKYDTVGVLVETVTVTAPAVGVMGKVRVRGRITANVDSGAAVAKGDFLAIGATAGRAVEYSGTDPSLRVIGTCQSTPADNTALVSINVHPRFAALG